MVDANFECAKSGCIYQDKFVVGQYGLLYLSLRPNPIQSNVNKRAQVFLFARIFYNVTFTYKLKHLRQWFTKGPVPETGTFATC